MRTDTGRCVASNRGTHNLARVYRRTVDGACEQDLETEIPVTIVQPEHCECLIRLVSELRLQESHAVARRDEGLRIERFAQRTRRELGCCGELQVMLHALAKAPAVPKHVTRAILVSIGRVGVMHQRDQLRRRQSLNAVLGSALEDRVAGHVQRRKRKYRGISDAISVNAKVQLFHRDSPCRHYAGFMEMRLQHGSSSVASGAHQYTKTPRPIRPGSLGSGAVRAVGLPCLPGRGRAGASAGPHDRATGVRILTLLVGVADTLGHTGERKWLVE